MPSFYPILEFDPAREAVIEPERPGMPTDLPEHCVPCFFQEVIDTLRAEHGAEVIHHAVSEIGLHPIYQLRVGDRPLAVFHPGFGAALGAYLLEIMISVGCRTFIACGGAGVLDRSACSGRILVPTSAVRDEGTSYHYLPPSREVAASPAAVQALERTLQVHRVDYVRTKTWTTDAFFRETPDRVRRRREEGCLAVEMEAAALFAVASFRSVLFAQLLYGMDDVGSEIWQGLAWATSPRERLFWLAAEACLAL